MYQSYKMLSGPHKNVRPHDFMDDLESFFYVLCHVTFLYDGGRPMKPTSSHPELKKWNSTRELAAGQKGFFLLDNDVPPDTPLDGLDTDTCNVVSKLIDSLRAVFVPILESYGRAVKVHRGILPAPMHVFESWEDYKTSAEEAYNDFLRPINEAIETLKATHRNWDEWLRRPPTVDMRTSEFATGASSPTSLVAAEDWSRAGSSLSLPLQSSTHTSRSSSKRPRSPVDDGAADPVYDGAGAGGSDARSRHAKKAKGPAQ